MVVCTHQLAENKARHEKELAAFRAAHPHISIASPRAAAKKPASKTKAAAKRVIKGPKRKAAAKKQEEELEWDSDGSDDLVEQALAELADVSDVEEDEDVPAPAGTGRTKTPTSKGGKPTNNKGAAAKSAPKNSGTHSTPVVPQLTSPTGKQRSASSAGRMQSMAAAAAAVTGGSRTQKRKVCL